MHRGSVVAIVDDESIIRTSLARFLQVVGFTVKVYASGKEFLDACTHDIPDCAVIDCQMPGLSGIDVLECLNVAGRGMPVIMFAATDDAEVRRTCKVLGARSLLIKPADGAAVLAAIAGALDV